MPELKGRLKRLLREYYWRAHDEELRRALAGLASDFEAWKAGGISGRELSDRIHKFHDGVSREIFNRYDGKMLEFTVARAIVTGILDRSQIPDELFEDLKESIESFVTLLPAR
jgi:hypothetical protein